MVTMKMGDVQEVWVADVVHQIIWKLIIAWKHEPGRKERRHEPRITHDGLAVCAHQDARVAK